MSAIQATDLVRRFGEVEAVRGVSLEVAEGEIYGFLGPNGAGKSTIVRILTTLLQPTSGSGSVLGHDVTAEPTTVRRLIGVALQEAGLDPKQTGRELLTLQGKLYGLKGKVLADQVAEVTELVGLTDAIDRRIQTYSGGMKRRLDLASALLHRPRVLFLDEPTTGLDPLSRALIWDRIRELRERFGATIFLTTQYLEEADELADRVAIIDHGRIVRQGTPAALKAEIGADVIDLAVEERETGAARAAITELQASGDLPEGELRGTADGYTLFVPDGPQNIAVLIRGLDKAGVRFGAVSVSRPTLDDVFLAATGGRMAAAHQDGQGEDGQARDQEPAGSRKEGIVSAAAPDAGRAPGRTRTGEPQTLAAPAGLVSDVVAITGRAIRGILREPELFIFALIIPVFFFVVQIGALGDVAEQQLGIANYATFQLPISILFAAASTSGGNALVLDIAGGYWDKLSLTPAHRSSLVVGNLFGEMFAVLGYSLVLLLFGFAIGVRFAEQPGDRVAGAARADAAVRHRVRLGQHRRGPGHRVGPGHPVDLHHLLPAAVPDPQRPAAGADDRLVRDGGEPQPHDLRGRGGPQLPFGFDGGVLAKGFLAAALFSALTFGLTALAFRRRVRMG